MSDGWHDDPLGRYSKRYHDGTNWTSYVTDGGVAELDPLGAAHSPAGGVVTAPPTAAGEPEHAGLPNGVTYATPWIRLASYLVDSFLIMVTFGIGWVIWALMTVGDGQTPAKRLLDLRVVSASTRRPVGFAVMFWLRGLVAAVVGWFVIVFTFGIILLMPFWDRRNQNLWDKISSTYVVQDPADAWGTRRP